MGSLDLGLLGATLPNINTCRQIIHFRSYQNLVKKNWLAPINIFFTTAEIIGRDGVEIEVGGNRGWYDTTGVARIFRSRVKFLKWIFIVGRSILKSRKIAIFSIFCHF